MSGFATPAGTLELGRKFLYKEAVYLVESTEQNTGKVVYLCLLSPLVGVDHGRAVAIELARIPTRSMPLFFEEHFNDV